MGQEVFAFLHTLKVIQPVPEKNDQGIHHKPKIIEGHIRCLYPDSIGVVVMATEGNYYYLLEELAASELLAIRNFIMKRLSEPNRKSLKQLTKEKQVKRKDLEGSTVVIQYDRFTIQSPAKLLYHASNGYANLGDCWLVKFLSASGSQSTQFTPSEMIYRASDFDPMPIG